MNFSPFSEERRKWPRRRWRVLLASFEIQSLSFDAKLRVCTRVWHKIAVLLFFTLTCYVVLQNSVWEREREIERYAYFWKRIKTKDCKLKSKFVFWISSIICHFIFRFVLLYHSFFWQKFRISNLFVEMALFGRTRLFERNLFTTQQRYNRPIINQSVSLNSRFKLGSTKFPLAIRTLHMNTNKIPAYRTLNTLVKRFYHTSSTVLVCIWSV
jgi:hypothetical protein